ncbi:hypothetical protein C3L33_18722, partial [Rhododendron williamsianum]
MFEHITTIELAGYGVGTFLLCATISAPKIDSLISTSQRRFPDKSLSISPHLLSTLSIHALLPKSAAQWECAKDVAI